MRRWRAALGRGRSDPAWLAQAAQQMASVVTEDHARWKAHHEQAAAGGDGAGTKDKAGRRKG